MDLVFTRDFFYFMAHEHFWTCQHQDYWLFLFLNQESENLSVQDQHFKNVDTKVKMSIQCGQSVTNAFEFAKALENLDGVRFQVLQMDRKHQPTTPKSLSDIHLISHISYIYDGNSCTGIKMLGQSFSNHQSIKWNFQIQTWNSQVMGKFSFNFHLRILLWSSHNSIGWKQFTHSTFLKSRSFLQKIFSQIQLKDLLFPFIKKLNSAPQMKKRTQRQIFLSFPKINKSIKNNTHISPILRCDFCGRSFIRQIPFTNHQKMCNLKFQ